MLALRAQGRTVASLAAEFGIPEESLKRWLRKNLAPGTSRASTASQDERDARGRVDRHDGESNAPQGVLADAVDTFRLAFGMEPMPHQVDYLTEVRDLAVLKGRQIGMTTAAAALAIHVARSGFGPDVVIVSPTQRQSSEVALRARNGLWTLGEELEQDSATVVRLANGSRIVSLAGTPRAVRGYSARLLIVDEAAWVTDETWAAARPVTSATGGRTVVQSTPQWPSGWFHDLWAGGAWAQMRVPSVGILDEAVLERERESLAPAVFAMEYLADFASIGGGGRWFDEEGYDDRVDPRFPALVSAEAMKGAS